MIEIEIDGATDAQSAEIDTACRAILAGFGRVRGTLSISVIDRDRMHALNRDALDHDWHTDVLSWNYLDGDPADGGDVIDGEVVLSRDYAAAEASTRGHDTNAEILLYAIHGLLHILGYDDQDPAAKATMEAEQDRWWRETLARRAR